MQAHRWIVACPTRSIDDTVSKVCQLYAEQCLGSVNAPLGVLEGVFSTGNSYRLSPPGTGLAKLIVARRHNRNNFLRTSCCLQRREREKTRGCRIVCMAFRT